MTPVLTQRWTDQQMTWRPVPEPFTPSNYTVAAIPDDVTAKAFVLQHHYSGSYPAAQHRFGLFRGSELQGVAVFSVPANYAALACLACPAQEATELGRLVLVDAVPGNAESWFVARCFDGLRREGVAGVVSFSDPVRRQTLAGEVVMPGHVGIVYQALNARYLGRSKADTLRLLPDGRCFHRRAQAKVRNGERGWEREVALLQGYGAGELGTESPREWLARWLPQVTRSLPHDGNHKYAWGLAKAVAKALPASLPYPEPPGGRVAPRWGRRAAELVAAAA